jgi:hypothetical protein
MIQVYPNPLELTGLTFFGQPIRNSSISTYSYISSIDFEVSIHDSGTNTYSSAFVYRCGDASAWIPFDSPLSVYGIGVTGASYYEFSPWKSNGSLGGEVRFNYLNFGTDSEVKVRVKSKKGNINSVDIGPYKKNFNSKWSKPSADTIEISGINSYDKLIIVTNNELSTPLYLFANPIDNVNPASVNLYLSAGIWEASAVNSNLGLDSNPESNFRIKPLSDYSVYLAPGCYLDGTISVRDLSNVTIFGNGVIDAGRPYVNNWWYTVGFFTNLSDSDKLKRSAIFAYSSFATDNAYEVTQRTKNIKLADVTIVNSIVYANTCALKQVDNAKLISLWPNCDGLHVYDVSSSDPNKSASMTRSFLQTGDDTVFPGDGGGRNIVSSCYLITLAGTTFRTYYGSQNYQNYRSANGYGFSAIDIDCRSYASPGYYGLPTALHETFTNAIFGLIQADRKKLWAFDNVYYPESAITNLFFSGIKVENLLDIPIFDIGIKSYAETPGFDAPDNDYTPNFGNISSLIFKDITVSSHPNSKYKWAKESKIFANEKNYRVHDLSFINVTVDNVPITNVNRNEYINWFNKPTMSEYDPTVPSYFASSIVDVYCLIGDSLADGVDSKYADRIGTNYSSLPSEITGCYIWIPYQYIGFTGTWPGPHFEVMRPGVNTLNYFYYPGANVTGTASLDNLLAWKLRQQSGLRDIYFVKYAQGGTMALSGVSSLYGETPDWSISSTGEMFHGFSSTVVSALANLKNQLKMPEFKGGVVFLGTNTPIQTANYLVVGYDATGNEVTSVNPYKNVASINSKIDTDLSSLVSGIRTIIGRFPSPRVDVYYSNIIWALPIWDSLGEYFINYDNNTYNSYFQKLRNKINSLSSVIPPPDCNVSLETISYNSPTGLEYRADFVHYNFSGVAKMADDVYQILQQQTSSVTDPSLNPDVNYQFSLSNGMKNWVKINGEWKEADAWIKKDGEWKFAAPSIKVSNNWK